MIARTTAVVQAGGVLGALACSPPLTLRQVRGEAADVCELRLVGTAAGPLAGDDLSLSLRLEPGARATLGAAGASLAQGRDGGGAAALSVRAELAAGAWLAADPGPLVVCAGSRVDVRLELVLAAGAQVEWHELVVLGRTGERPGRATVRWDVTRDGRPVLRQLTDLTGLGGGPRADGGPGPAEVARAGAGTAGRRVLACALISGPELAARTVVAGPQAAAQQVDEQTVLVTVLDDDAARATRQLGELRDEVRTRPVAAADGGGR